MMIVTHLRVWRIGNGWRHSPLRTVVGYRALAVDYNENGRFGKNGLDLIQHRPVMGISLRW